MSITYQCNINWRNFFLISAFFNQTLVYVQFTQKLHHSYILPYFLLHDSSAHSDCVFINVFNDVWYIYYKCTLTDAELFNAVA